MYNYCAHIIDDVVDWVLCCTDVSICTQYADGLWLPVFDNNICSVGWIWNGESFVNPNPQEVEDEID